MLTLSEASRASIEDDKSKLPMSLKNELQIQKQKLQLQSAAAAMQLIVWAADEEIDSDDVASRISERIFAAATTGSRFQASCVVDDRQIETNSRERVSFFLQ